MRKLIVAEFIALDGVVESPERWHMAYVDAEMFAAMWPAGSDIDTLLLGRVTYDSFAGAFAHGSDDDPVVANMNRPEKIVVTSAAGDLSWRNSRKLDGPDVAAAVRALKAEPGGSIAVVGSTTLARTLLDAGLVDEISLLLHPVVVGTGERLFPAAGPGATFELASCAPLKSGVVHLTYRKA
jgi:dihydrofolate reductase